MGEGTLILQNYRPMSVSTQVNEKETPEKTAPPPKKTKQSENLAQLLI